MGWLRFWAICHMLHTMDELVGNLEGWSSGCPCHDHIVELRDTSYLRKAALNRELGLKASEKGPGCPLQGCRAPELASGKMEAWVWSSG
jgi:hypothetical protein